MKKAKPVGKISPVAKKSNTLEYYSPNLFNVAVELTPDDPDFTPVYNEQNWADIKIIVPRLNHQGVQALRLNHRVTEILDCGISLKIPEGFRLVFSTKNSWASRGLFVSKCYLDGDRVKLIITNIGQETPLVLNHKDVIAQISLEPVYFFDWNKNG